MLVPPPPSGGAAVLAGFQMIAAFQVGRPDFSIGQWSLKWHLSRCRVGFVPAHVTQILAKAKA